MQCNRQGQTQPELNNAGNIQVGLIDKQHYDNVAVPRQAP